MKVELKQATQRLLKRVHSRREHVLSKRQHPLTGYWIMTRQRIRTLKDYILLAEAPRIPQWARERALRWIAQAVGEARRFAARNPSG